MRTSILSRSAIAVATLAVGSAAFAAVPANAASASGVTRDQVLTAANGVRAATAADTGYSRSTLRLMRTIAEAGCDAVGDNLTLVRAKATQAGEAADGLVLTSSVQSFDGTTSQCTIAAFAASDTSSTLQGTATLTGSIDVFFPSFPPTTSSTPVSETSALSGDVAITPAYTSNVPTGFSTTNLDASANGTATKTTTTTTNVKVKDTKSKGEKKAAKKKFSKRLAQAKKNYAKALDKAGSSKNKKAAAKRVYAKARALAKAKYAADTAGFKIVKKTTTSSAERAFSITTATPEA